MSRQFYEKLENIKVKSKTIKGKTQQPYLDYLDARYINVFDIIQEYREFTVTDPMQGRLDLIAHNVYGSCELWWFIGMYNSITNPTYEVFTGKVLKIPPIEIVDALITESSQTQASTNIVELK